MARKNFTQFENVEIPSTSDYVVGFKGDESVELKTTVQNILNLVPPPVLTYNENTYELRALGLSGSNAVSLSSVDVVKNGEVVLGTLNNPITGLSSNAGSLFKYLTVKINGELYKIPVYNF